MFLDSEWKIEPFGGNFPVELQKYSQKPREPFRGKLFDTILPDFDWEVFGLLAMIFRQGSEICVSRIHGNILREK